MFERREDGRVVADTAGMHALTGRSLAAIRMTCRRGTEGYYDADECTDALIGTPDPIVLTAAEAESYLGIKSNTVYKWVSRKRLRAVDRDRYGRGQYALADLLRLAGADPDLPR
jgi:excisionase family DNA binding protein